MPQCSGTLLLARLGLLADHAGLHRPDHQALGGGGRACGVDDSPFRARGPIATAGGCLASQYLAAWPMVASPASAPPAQALHYAAPVGEKESYVKRVLDVVRPFVADAAD